MCEEAAGKAVQKGGEFLHQTTENFKQFGKNIEESPVGQFFKSKF